jgi:hypothetical protein
MIPKRIFLLLRVIQGILDEAMGEARADRPAP